MREHLYKQCFPSPPVKFAAWLMLIISFLYVVASLYCSRKRRERGGVDCIKETTVSKEGEGGGGRKGEIVQILFLHQGLYLN